MIEQMARRAHHILKNTPVLRWIDAAGCFIWFRGIIPTCRGAYATGLFLKLIVVRIAYQKKLLILYRFGGIGDIICSLPAVREFTRQHVEAQIVYVTLTSFRGLIKRSDLGICCVTSGMHVVLPHWVIRLVGSSVELNYSDEAEVLTLPLIHLVQQFARTLGLASVPEELFLRLDRRKIEKIRTQNLPKGKTRLVLLHTGPTWKVKEWPMELWVALVDRLRQNPEVQICQIIANRNITVKSPSCPLVRGAVPLDCTDNIPRLIDTIGAADLLIGIDSGPVHIATAVGTRCVALFGPTDPSLLLQKSALAEPVIHRIDCSFCHHRRPRLHWQSGCPHEIICMKNITVDQVLSKAAAIYS